MTLLSLLLAAAPLAGAVRLNSNGSALAQHPWPCKNGNTMRTGQGLLSGSGPTDLSRPTWVFEASDGTFYQSPVVDKDRNAYFSSTNGVLYSMAPTGRLNWEVQLRKEDRHGGQMPTPVLYGDSLYTVDGQGWLVALALDTGKERWRTQHGYASGDDSWSMGLDEKTRSLFAVSFPTEADRTLKKCPYGGTHMMAMDLDDGHLKWSYELKACNCNIMPSAMDGMVLFSDQTGNVYALDARTGREIWTRPGTNRTFTTGTAAISDSGLIFVSSNLGPGHGVLKTYDVHTGAFKWQRTFDREANNAPAVFRDKKGRLLVAMGISNNAGMPRPILDGRMMYYGTVFTMDALTGRTLWEFSPPVWRNPACAGSSARKLCLPDAFTNPSVDAAGTLYIGWMGGVVYGLNGSTGQELASWSTRSGMQGAPGIADGLLAVSSCQRMAGFLRH